MPIINPILSNTPLAILSGAATMEVHLSGGIGLKPRCYGTSELIVRLSRTAAGAATIENSSSLEVFGRLNNEPNKFGAAILEANSTLEINPRRLLRGVAILSGSSGITAKGRINAPDSDELILLVKVIDPFLPGFGKTYSARLGVDGDFLPIKDFSFNAGRDLAGIDLNVTLARQADRGAFDSSSLFNFDFFNDSAWKTLFSSGKLKADQFSIGYQNGRATDNATLSTNAPVSAMLDKSPNNNQTFYDSSRLTLNLSEFQDLFDTDGNRYSHELFSKPGLTFYELCNSIFVDICGFSDVKTTIKDFPIQRADFSIFETYFDGVSKHIGVYSPLVFVKNNVLWLLDSTAQVPSDFAIAEPLTIDKYKSADLSKGQGAIDGFVIQYSEIGDEYDYFLFRDDDPEITESGNLFDSDYSKTTTITTWRDYYKNSNSAIPIRSERSKRSTISAGTFGDVIASEIETFEYDSLSRATKTTIVSEKVIPALADPFEFSLTKVSEKTITYKYKADLFNPRRTFCYLTEETEFGLIMIDENRPQLGKPFKQSFDKAYFNGNLEPGQTTDFVAISKTTKTLTQKPNGQFSSITRFVDFLKGQDGQGFIVTTTGTESAGDITINAQTSQTKEAIVLKSGAARTNRKMLQLSGGEIPLKDLIELARRRIDRIGKRSGSVLLKGVDLSCDRGTIREIFGRDNQSLGVFMIEGFQITGRDLGLSTQQTNQTIEVFQL